MFLAQTDFLPEYSDKYPLQLTWDQVDFITKNALLEAMGHIEDGGGVDDISTYDAMVETLAYFTNKQEQELLTMRTINPEWLNLVADQKVAV